MLNFYSFSEAVRVLFSAFTVFGVMPSSLCLVLCGLRFRRGILYWVEILLSFLALCQTVICAALIAQVQLNISEGFMVPGGYGVLRRAVLIAVAAVSVYPCIKRKFILPVTAVVSSFLTLPVMEVWTGGLFPAAFTAALAVQLSGSSLTASSIVKELQTSISGLSVKKAMDLMNTAVLFCKKNGHIILQNDKMQELMIKTAGRILYNGKLYLEKTVVSNSEHTLGGSYLYRLPESSWLFTVKEIKLGKTPVIQLTATDVTEQNCVNQILQDKRKKLNSQRKEIMNYIETIEENRRLEELLRIKTEAHDAQNQKLTVLLRHLRQGQWPPDDILNTIGESLVSGIQKNSSMSGNPQTELETLTGVYRQAGVKIIFDGELIPDKDISLMLISILREAAANAILHGHADEVYAAITKNEKSVVMRVTDNSKIPTKAVREGSGIAEMRRQLAAFGGELNIDVDAEKRFILTVTVSQM